MTLDPLAVVRTLGFTLSLCIAFAWSLSVSAAELPGVTNPQRAQVNYMLNCQGCHGAQGTAAPGANVPALKNYVGNFLLVPGGRDFLVQVPGSANAAMNDAALAELLNWMLPTLSADQLTDSYQPYTEVEIKKLRASPLQNVATRRSELVTLIEKLKATAN